MTNTTQKHTNIGYFMI